MVPSVSPWYAPSTPRTPTRSRSSLLRSLSTPSLAYNISRSTRNFRNAILSATSTAVDPSSEKNARAYPPWEGCESIASVKSSAGSCTFRGNSTWPYLPIALPTAADRPGMSSADIPCTGGVENKARIVSGWLSCGERASPASQGRRGAFLSFTPRPIATIPATSRTCVHHDADASNSTASSVTM